MAIRFASKETPPEPAKPKKQAVPAQSTSPEPKAEDKPDDQGPSPVPAAGDLFGSGPKKAPRARKAK